MIDINNYEASISYDCSSYHLFTAVYQMFIYKWIIAISAHNPAKLPGDKE